MSTCVDHVHEIRKNYFKILNTLRRVQHVLGCNSHNFSGDMVWAITRVYGPNFAAGRSFFQEELGMVKDNWQVPGVWWGTLMQWNS